MGGIKLGIYDGNEIILKRGKYGLYIVWGEQKKSLSGLFPKNKNPSSITYNEIVKIIENGAQVENVNGGGDVGGDGSGGGGGSTLLIKGMVRKITDDISIRNGKYGDYIFYKTAEMKNPTFLKLKGFTGDYKTCSISNIFEWIQKTYKI
jgi:DNA topoisomerase-1